MRDKPHLLYSHIASMANRYVIDKSECLEIKTHYVYRISPSSTRSAFLNVFHDSHD